jgi:hypothetical protein
MDHDEVLAAARARLIGATDEAALVADEAAVDAHLQACAACRAEMAAEERVWGALGRVPAEPLEPAFSARLLPQLRAATLARPERLRRRRVLRAVAVSGVTFAAAAALVLVLRPRTVPLTPAPTEVASAPAPSSPPLPLLEPTAERMAALVADVRSTDGSRAKAIALAGASLDRGASHPPDAIVDALTRTLRSDRNPGVRLRAAEALARLWPTPQIRAAFIRALEHDGNPAVRIVAVEALGKAARDFDAASIEALRERAADQSESTHLRTRVARALRTIEL